MMNHREAPFRLMAHVGMMGWLATGLPLDKATSAEMAELKAYFELFKKIRHVTCRGEHPSPKDIYLPKAKPAYRPRSGRGLMEAGLHVDLFGDYDSRIFHFKEHHP
jgi:hypothetical protein